MDRMECYERDAYHVGKHPRPAPGFSLRILVVGERCNITGEYFERGSMSE